MTTTPAPFTAAELAAFTDKTIENMLKVLPADTPEAKALFLEGARRAQAKLEAAREKAQRTILMGDWTVTMVPRKWERGYSREYDRNARVYVSVDGLEKVFPELAASLAALPAPLDRGEDKANDQAYDRHNRLYAKLSKQVAMEAVVGLIETGKLDRVGQELKASFSRTAGCSCPCSPGVVLNSLLFIAADSRRCDIYISKTLAN